MTAKGTILKGRTDQGDTLPFDHRTDESGVLHLTAWGTLTYEEVVGALNALELDPQVRRPLRQILDATRVERVELSGPGIWDAAQHGHHQTPGSRIAVVVASEVIFGLARMFEQMLGLRGVTVQVFRDMDEARGWLDEEP